MYESYTSASQHPQVLSAKDFKDGFSLEACIPPEIARLDQCDDGSSTQFEGRSGSSVRSRKSSNSVKSSSAQPNSRHDTPNSYRAHHAAEDSGSVGTSSQISGGYHTPLLSTPVFGRVDCNISPTSATPLPPLRQVNESENNDCMDISPPPTSSTFHHPHFYNHQKFKTQKTDLSVSSEFRNLPKPTSPYPQRRALSPKMTSSPIKLISSDDSSSSHTTPTPQRRANLLDLFRSGSKRSKHKENKNMMKQDDESSDNNEIKTYSDSRDSDGKVKSKPLWKTWERSKGKKSDKNNKTSIFGTTRKSDKKKTDSSLVIRNESGFDASMNNDLFNNEASGSANREKDQDSTLIPRKAINNRTSSSLSSDSNRDQRNQSNEDNGFRSSSSPIVRSAAFCIMKLEELERSIEETIREKFPDAEPFLLKKRSKEDETRGSRSLPSTPSLKKKLYVARDMNDSKRNSHRDNTESADVNGITRYCDETTCPSPAMSPVILRRFGARTRHASISPKIPRAKTAMLYNSPSEITTMEKSVSTKTVTKVPVYHAVSSYRHQNATLTTQFTKPMTSSQKSASKYDNVMDDEYDTPVVTRVDRSTRDEPSDSDENEDDKVTYDNVAECNDRAVIVPTFSAVFGSVSPKLKRHLQSKLVDNKSSDKLGNEKKENVEYLTTSSPGHKYRDSVDCVAPSSTNITYGSFSYKRQQDNTSLKTVIHTSMCSATTVPTVSVKPSSIKTACETFTSSLLANPPVTLHPLTTTVTAKGEDQQSLRLKMTDVNKKVPHCQSVGDDVSSQSSGSNNTGISLADNLQATPRHNQEPLLALGATDERKNRTRVINNLPCIQQQQAGRVDTEKSTSLTSPLAQRKHSTDHVVFGSAVALPCRLYSNAPLSPPPPLRCSQDLKDTSKLNISIYSEVSSENITGERQNARYVAVQNSALCEADRAELDRTRCFTTETGESTNTRVSLNTAKPCVQPVHGSNIIRVDDSHDKHVSSTKHNRNDKLRVNVADDIVHETRQHGDSSTDYWKGSVPIREKDRHGEINYEPIYREDGQSLAVLKNPVSKVISEMIHNSKQEEQKQRLQQQHQQRRQLHQSSPGYGVKHVQEAVAVVTSPTYEHTCLALEEKTVRSDSSVSLPASPTCNSARCERDFSSSDPEVKESKCQEIQTDSIVTADKGVDSNSLTRTAVANKPIKSNQFIPMVRDFGKTTPCQTPPEGQKPKPVGDDDGDELDSSDETEFLKKVLASKQSAVQKKSDNASGVSEHAPPPPSPTAMQHLMEEFDEEDEDDDDLERREIELAMRRESEIKEFTDKIYNRLSSLLGSQEEIDDNVFEDEDAEGTQIRGVDQLLSRLERERESHYSSSASEDDAAMFKSSSSKIQSSERGQTKILTIETSSSNTTTTSSESDLYEETPIFQPPVAVEDHDDNDSEESDEKSERLTAETEFDTAGAQIYSEDTRQRRSSREYHSDDDVATGRGIPDYYDDRPLWTRRQKTPGQLSAAMMAIRRRERRDRWLKKRRRNKTDLLSTGSSDTGSEHAYTERSCERRDEKGTYFRYDDDDEFVENEKRIQRNEMGSGILTSPKYSKPILPFGNSAAKGRAEEEISFTKVAPNTSYYREERSKSLSAEDIPFTGTLSGTHLDKISYDDKVGHNNEVDEYGGSLPDITKVKSDTNLAIPGIEETFNELMSVQHILEELQDRAPTHPLPSDVKCMPLTTENVKSIREYYKDCYSSGNGRRSRMSATDRTESDLDLYSETRDDESTDSNFNADDEEDEDNLEPYATADDELAATGGSSSAGHSGSYRDSRHGPGDDDDSETNVVVSCTFYNSNAFPALVDSSPAPVLTPSTPVARSSVKSTPKTLTPTAQASLLNSDEEFWSGSTAVDETYKQVVTTADAVSSTFQNAREQMHEIQHHLQALRRQMEVEFSTLLQANVLFSKAFLLCEHNKTKPFDGEEGC
ncbi:hypothetical protein Btru_054519 [Bulinus truncatus]|nr:hypothetical protein Btru_054519 [Bulinus truncatus]